MQHILLGFGDPIFLDLVTAMSSLTNERLVFLWPALPNVVLERFEFKDVKKGASAG